MHQRIRDRIQMAVVSALAAILCGQIVSAQELILPGSTWSYSDLQTPSENWSSLEYNDARWATGPAQLGYGENDEQTMLGFGPDPKNKRRVCYFRHSFSSQPLEPNDQLLLRLIADDGAVVYLNGQEIHRLAMPEGELTDSTWAIASYYGTVENQWHDVWLPQNLLREGRNVLAVAVYQASATTSDLSFDLSLFLDEPAKLSRGPYLQMAAPNSMQVRWRTAVKTAGIVRFGTDQNSLNLSATHAGSEVEHQVDLQNLLPATTYFYSIEDESGALTKVGPEFQFTTPPTMGETQSFRVMAFGDSGTATRNAAAVRNSMIDLHHQEAADFWMMLGDNAYGNGTDAQYQRAVFDFYPSFLQQLPLWSTRGNHETIPEVYYRAFTFPQAGEAGGVASGTEAYYSFDWAHVHFICLDSQGTDRSSDGAMVRWLEQDMAETDQDWIVAFWHHPPYTKGTHDSDDIEDSGGRMGEMRENVLPTLEAGGVDLVLAGHSHAYERSYMIGGHYGLSTEFQAEMKLDSGDGSVDGDGPYLQHAGLAAGAVYCVAGSSGSTSKCALDHPAMFRSLPKMGALVLDFDAGQLDVMFVGKNGDRLDAFRLIQSQSTASKSSEVHDAAKSSASKSPLN